MGEYRFRNVACAWCGENIAQAIKPPGEAMHQRCKTLSHSPVGFVSSGDGRRKRTEMVQCVWCMAWRERRVGRKEAPTCGFECRAAWNNYSLGRIACLWPKKFTPKSSQVYFIKCLECLSWKCSKNPGTRYCSGVCGSKHSHLTGKSTPKRRLVWFKDCIDCGSLYCAKSSIQRRCYPCKALHEYRVSEDSSKVSKLLPYIGKRDNWTCQICSRPVRARKYDYSDRLSPTVDHVVTKSEARAAGWSDSETHDLANLRLAHMTCNSRRSDRGGNEQLALIG